MAEGTEQQLPRWDLTPYFRGVEATDLAAAQEEVRHRLEALERLFEEQHIRRQELHVPEAREVELFERMITLFNTLLDDVHVISAYLSAMVDCDAGNAVAQAKLSEWQRALVPLRKLDLRLDAWLGSLDLQALLTCSDVAREHRYALERAQVAARHQMSEEEEALAAHLTLSGGTAWVKLHHNVSARLMVELVMPDGVVQRLPMAAVRNLAYDANGAVREAAYRAELTAWAEVAVPLAAALNGVKGEVNTLSERRGWKSALEQALFVNGIDTATLEAMQEACEESFADFRRYLQTKARYMGKALLPWWDLFAPLESSEAAAQWDFTRAAQFVKEQFATYGEPLAALVQRAVAERWIDAEPREGKVGGAYCMRMRNGESRVLMNFKPAFGSVQTLAHELGHAYHNTRLAQRTAMQRATPMALAETASIFCERLVTAAALSHVSQPEALAIVEEGLQNACQVIVDIHSRFLFEQAVFEKRQKRELSVEEFNELMLEAQRATYGEGLDPATYHPYMWAVKGHYYSTGRSYYNWPYAFGLLFGLGLFARYRENPVEFQRSYDALLASTGLASVPELAGRFGIDVHSLGFWRSSLDVIRADIARFVDDVEMMRA